MTGVLDPPRGCQSESITYDGDADVVGGGGFKVTRLLHHLISVGLPTLRSLRGVSPRYTTSPHVTSRLPTLRVVSSTLRDLESGAREFRDDLSTGREVKDPP